MTFQSHTEDQRAAINARLDQMDKTLRAKDARGDVGEDYDKIEDEFAAQCIALHELDATE
jgi:hypothetical protein